MELLKKSVQSVLEKERIGSPVFLRCVLHVAGDASNLLSSVAEMAALANGWMTSPPARVYAQGDADGNTGYGNGSLCRRADGTLECQSGRP